MPFRFTVSACATRAAITALVLVFAGCHSADKPTGGSPMKMKAITGEVSYRLRIALPSDAVVNVRLEDASTTDAAATLVAETNIASEGRQVPIPFTLEYDVAKIESNHQYSVRAAIKSGEQLLFASTRAYRVLTGGAGDHIEILVEQAHSSESKPDASGDIALEDTFWRMVELNGKPALPSTGQRQAGITFVANNHIIGANTGVNGMGGEYTINGNSLMIKPGMMTMMAGPEPMMKQEQAFVAALGNVTTYRISGRTLELLAGDTIVMKLEAAAE